jgi:hypothetical protein
MFELVEAERAYLPLDLVPSNPQAVECALDRFHRIPESLGDEF